MSKLNNIQTSVSRRDAIKRIAATFFAAGLAGEVSTADQQHVHAGAASMKGALGEINVSSLPSMGGRP